jgi:hypothetical protein
MGNGKQTTQQRTMMEQLSRLTPLARPELPGLTGCHNAHHAIPRICTEFCQCLDAVNNEIARILSVSSSLGSI